MINWSKLKPYDTDQKRSFEELCYQIARVYFNEEGKFTSVDDSGGGDGVEFYLTTDTGDVYGWQAKFYSTGRLTASRKASIIGSLEKSYKVHPKIKKWYLCMPLDFTPNEKTWFDEVLTSKVPIDMEIELIFWGDSEFNHHLANPKLIGRKNYFFGDLELTMEWFDNQLKKQLAAVKGKFNPYLHTETEVDLSVHATLLNENFVNYLNKEYERLKIDLDNFKSSIAEIQKTKIDEKQKNKILEYYYKIGELIESWLTELYIVETTLKSNEYESFTPGPLEMILTRVETVSREYSIEIEKILQKEISMNEKIDEHEKSMRRRVWIEIKEPIYKVEDFIFDFSAVLKEIRKGTFSDLYIFGNAGYGKTHVSANICNLYMQKKSPAIFIPGNSLFNSDIITNQLKNLLDIPSNYSWQDFLKALDTAGKAFRTKIPIIIDGLNEVRDQEIIKNGIHSFIQEINSYNNLTLICTCRITYINSFWKSSPPENSIYMNGFNEENIEKVIEKYFSHYKLNADLTTASLVQFEHPLYLQIFCETKNHKREIEVDVSINDESIFDIFESYLFQCNEIISNKLGFDSRRNIIGKTLMILGKYLWENNTRFIPLDDVSSLIEDNSSRWNTSIQKNLEDENLLIYRDWNQNSSKEVVSFSYDLLGGFIIASYLIKNHQSSFEEFANEDYTKKLLFDDDFNSHHPLNEDITRSLAALLPKTTKKYLFDYYKNSVTFNVTIKTWFELSPQYISTEAVSTITKLFDEKNNRERLLELAEKTLRQIQHPLNIEYWSSIFLHLPMAERDKFWTEHIRLNKDLYDHVIDLLEEKSRKNELSSFEENYVHILAKNVTWLLCSTIKSIRDKATKALYHYGRKHPIALFDLVKSSFKINDPYISERTLASMYGVAMAEVNNLENSSFADVDLPKIGLQLYNIMFNEKASFKTSHILTRDYSKRIIDLAVLKDPSLLSKIEIKNITPPFKSNYTWGKFEENKENKLKYDPIEMDFKNYTLGRLVQNRSNYDFEHEEYNKIKSEIYWRIFDLGYDTEQFADIDIRINNQNFRFSRDDNGSKTDRYGKKYSWIAFYEMAGYLKDLGRLDNEWDVEQFRIIDLDIDPSFPEEVKEIQVVKENFIDSSLSAEKWIFGNYIPNFTNNFVLTEINAEKGPWVLLDGYFTEEDEGIEQSIFFFPRSLLVHSEKSEELLTELNNQELKGRWLPEVPSDSLTYAGEIPWSETFLFNGTTSLEFVVDIQHEKELQNQQALFRNGIPLTNEEIDKIRFNYINYSDLEDDIDIDMNFFLGMSVRDYSRCSEELKKYNIEVKTIEVEVSIERKHNKTIEVVLPVRSNGWEEGKSEAVPGRNIVVPAKEIASFLNLFSQPQTFDLFDSEGRKASISTTFGENYKNKQQFTYIRKDLLDKYLTENNLDLIWAIWGEKELPINSKKMREELIEKYDTFRQEFQFIQKYEKEWKQKEK